MCEWMSVLRKFRTLTKDLRLWKKSCFEVFLEGTTSIQYLWATAGSESAVFGLDKEIFLEKYFVLSASSKSAFYFAPAEPHVLWWVSRLGYCLQVMLGKKCFQNNTGALKPNSISEGV